MLQAKFRLAKTFTPAPSSKAITYEYFIRDTGLLYTQVNGVSYMLAPTETGIKSASVIRDIDYTVEVARAYDRLSVTDHYGRDGYVFSRFRRFNRKGKLTGYVVGVINPPLEALEDRFESAGTLEEALDASR